MGDRFFLDLKCGKCGAMNEDVYYAPTCDFTDFKCRACGTVNEIGICFCVNPQDLESKKTELEEEGE